VTAVWIGDKGPFRFLFDTGATTTVIDRSLARSLGLQVTGTLAAVSTTGAVSVEESIVGEMRAGKIILHHSPVLIAALPRFPSHGDLDGILGMSFFADHSVLIDVRRRCVEMGVAPPRGGVRVDARNVAGRVAIDIEGLSFVLDSGASFPVLMSARARSLAVQGEPMDVTSAAGRQRTRSATIPVLRIGRKTFRDVAVALAPHTDPREDGLLPVTAFESVYIAGDRENVVIR
jgi:predicted aspartyl protease